MFLTHPMSVFEGCQHQSVANQQSPKSGDSLHKMGNGSTPDFSSPTYQRKKQSGHARLGFPCHWATDSGTVLTADGIIKRKLHSLHQKAILNLT